MAFLGRLNPIGVVFAGLLLALSYIGGESAQIQLGLPVDMTSVFQGVLLFLVLACDTLIKYRIRVVPSTIVSGSTASNTASNAKQEG